jgi:hypothetical protein
LFSAYLEPLRKALVHAELGGSCFERGSRDRVFIVVVAVVVEEVALLRWRRRRREERGFLRHGCSRLLLPLLEEKKKWASSSSSFAFKILPLEATTDEEQRET